MWLDRYEAPKRLLLWIWTALPLSRRARSAAYWLLGSKFAVGVQALIFDEAGRLLLLRHTYKGRYPWGLPGGGMQRGETTTRALLREVREETGLAVTVARLLGVATQGDRLLVEIFYLCRAHGGTFTPNAEIAGLAYFDPAQLPPDLDPRLRRILRRLIGARAAPRDRAARRE